VLTEEEQATLGKVGAGWVGLQGLEGARDVRQRSGVGRLWLGWHPCSPAGSSHRAHTPPFHCIQMEAEAAVGDGARLFCPNPSCSQLLIADDKQEDTALECEPCRRCTPVLWADVGGLSSPALPSKPQPLASAAPLRRLSLSSTPHHTHICTAAPLLGPLLQVPTAPTSCAPTAGWPGTRT
jgi:hypothetical protein